MPTIKIPTTQNVEIEFELASIGDRILGALIDFAAIIIYSIAVGIFLSSLAVSDSTISLVLLILFYLPAFLYDFLLETFLNGQSIGKTIRKIKVVRLDGSSANIGGYFLRWLFRIVDIYICYGGIAIVTILINGKGQRLGDLAAGTTVIKLRSNTTLDETIFTRVDEDYTPVFPGAARLESSTIATIKEVLNAEVEEERMGRVTLRLALKMKDVLEARMNISSTLPPRTFLETILKDYNYLNGRI
ncbi:MAG: RDD family protein [Calditrichota bacterium]|jgi:uncharacterized RDD family membrane protein YckC